MENCYFCGSDRTESFAEHFLLCKKCSAIYTFDKDVHAEYPVALRLPQRELLKGRPAILKKEA